MYTLINTFVRRRLMLCVARATLLAALLAGWKERKHLSYDQLWRKSHNLRKCALTIVRTRRVRLNLSRSQYNIFQIKLKKKIVCLHLLQLSWVF